MNFWLVSFVVVGVSVALLMSARDYLGGAKSFFTPGVLVKEEVGVDSKVDLRQKEEIKEYIRDNLECTGNLPYVLEGMEFSVVRKEYSASEDKRVITGEDGSFFVSSRVPGQTVQFFLDGGDSSLPIVILVPGLDKGFSSLLEVGSVGERFKTAGYTVIRLRLLSDREWVNRVNTYLQYTGSDLESIQVAEVQTVLDFLELQYTSSFIVIYGEGWGSVLARDVGVLDDRVDLVISEGYFGDPVRYFHDNAVELIDSPNWSSIYLGSSEFCSSGTLESFGRLVPKPHVFVVEKGKASDYLVGSLVSVIKSKYRKIGEEEKFIYLESREEVLGMVRSLLQF